MREPNSFEQWLRQVLPAPPLPGVVVHAGAHEVVAPNLFGAI